ncbi:MAG: DNA polymerase III subunit delta [Planctomycetota bacterium]
MSHNRPYPVYVIAGKDKFLAGQEYETLLDQLLPPEKRTMCLYIPEPDKVTAADVFDELRTLPFLADRRVVLIKDADDFISQYRTHLENYFDNPSTSGVLILMVSSWPKNTRLAKKLTNIGRLLLAEEPKPRELAPFVVNYAKTKHDKLISQSTAQLLVELVGDSTGSLAAEVDKLALFAGETKKIAPSDVELLIGHNRLFNIFEVIDAMASGRLDTAFDRVRRIFALDKNAPFTVVGAFAFHYRRMFTSRVLLEKGLSQNQIASKLRIWGNKESFFRQLHKVTLSQVACAIQQLACIDYAIKTGQITPQVAIEQFIAQGR